MHETNISKVMALLERDGININWQNKAVGNVPFPLTFVPPPQSWALMVSYLYVVGTENGIARCSGEGQHNAGRALARTRR